MSVILFACNEIFVSDILITTEMQDVKTVDIPTFLNKADLYSDKLSMVKVNNLKQKSYVINDLLVLSLSGSVYEMKTFLGDIKSHFRHVETNLDNIKKFLENYDEKIIKKISACFSFYHKEYGFFYGTVGKDWQYIEHHLYGRFCTCGSGGKWFIEEFGEQLNELGIGNVEEFNLNEHQKKIESLKSRIFIQLGKFICEERFTANTIKELWGGGFEIICLEDGCFKKLDDYSYVIVSHRFKDNGEIEAALLLAINYKYYNDVLLLTCTDFSNIKRYVVTPLGMTQDEFDKIQFSNFPIFESKRVIGYYFVKMPDNTERHSIFDYQNKNSDEEPTIELSFSSNRFHYRVKTEFQDIVLGDIIAEGRRMLFKNKII